MTEPTGPDPGVPERAPRPERERQDPPLAAKVIVVTFAACIGVFLLFCLALILIWIGQGLWGLTVG